MKLDRNINENGDGKYALVSMRRVRELRGTPGDVQAALDTLEQMGCLQWGSVGEADEFFVIKLKDQNAHAALRAYAGCARVHGDEEYANEIAEMALRSGPYHPLCKKPD